MRRLEVKLDRNRVTRVEGPAILERHVEGPEKSVDEWSKLTVKNMFVAAERALEEEDHAAN